MKEEMIFENLRVGMVLQNKKLKSMKALVIKIDLNKRCIIIEPSWMLCVGKPLISENMLDKWLFLGSVIVSKEEVDAILHDPPILIWWNKSFNIKKIMGLGK